MKEIYTTRIDVQHRPLVSTLGLRLIRGFTDMAEGVMTVAPGQRDLTNRAAISLAAALSTLREVFGADSEKAAEADGRTVAEWKADLFSETIGHLRLLFQALVAAQPEGGTAASEGTTTRASDETTLHLVDDSATSSAAPSLSLASAAVKPTSVAPTPSPGPRESHGAAPRAEIVYSSLSAIGAFLEETAANSDAGDGGHDDVGVVGTDSPEVLYASIARDAVLSSYWQPGWSRAQAQAFLGQPTVLSGLVLRRPSSATPSADGRHNLATSYKKNGQVHHSLLQVDATGFTFGRSTDRLWPRLVDCLEAHRMLSGQTVGPHSTEMLSSTEGKLMSMLGR